jgi:hypothetical protein
MCHTCKGRQTFENANKAKHMHIRTKPNVRTLEQCAIEMRATNKKKKATKKQKNHKYTRTIHKNKKRGSLYAQQKRMQRQNRKGSLRHLPQDAENGPSCYPSPVCHSVLCGDRMRPPPRVRSAVSTTETTVHSRPTRRETNEREASLCACDATQ